MPNRNSSGIESRVEVSGTLLRVKTAEQVKQFARDVLHMKGNIDVQQVSGSRFIVTGSDGFDCIRCESTHLTPVHVITKGKTAQWDCRRNDEFKVCVKCSVILSERLFCRTRHPVGSGQCSFWATTNCPSSDG